MDMNKAVSCKDPRIQLFLIAVTSRLDAVVACINVLHPMEKLVIRCILTYAVVKVYGICLLREH